MKRTPKLVLKIVVFALLVYLLYSYRKNEEFDRITRVIQMSAENKNAIDAHINGHPEEAIRSYSELITQYPEQTWLYRQRGDIYSFLNEYSKALRDYQRVDITKSSFESPNQIPLKMGLIHMKLEQFDSSVMYFKKILKSSYKPTEHFDYDLERWSANHQLGKIYFLKEEYLKSIQYFSNALAIDRNTNTLYHRANTYYLLGQEELALKDYNESITEVRKYHIHKNPHLKEILCDTCPALFGTSRYLLATENWRTIDEKIQRSIEIDSLSKNHPKSIRIKKYIDSLIMKGKSLDTTFKYNIYE